MKTYISPSILSADLTRLGHEMQICEESGADFIHIDVMDGRFVPNITFGPDIVAAVKRSTSLPLDVHMMILEPEKHLERFIQAGADYVTVHVENNALVHRLLQTIRELGAKPGLVFNPGTPLESLRWLANDVDMVLLMSVNPGFGGQKFIQFSMQKIAEARRILNESGSEAMLQVDGGIDVSTIRQAFDAGANNFVAGTAVFGYPQGIVAGLSALRNALV